MNDQSKESLGMRLKKMNQSSNDISEYESQDVALIENELTEKVAEFS